MTLPHRDPDELLRVIDDMNARVVAHGRMPEGFHINARCQQGVSVDELLAVAEHGAASVHVPLWSLDEPTIEGKIAAIERFADEVVAPFRAVAGSGR